MLADAVVNNGLMLRWNVYSSTCVCINTLMLVASTREDCTHLNADRK